MKKIIFFILLLTIAVPTFASKELQELNKIPNNFQPKCYEYYNKIDSSVLSETKTYKLQIPINNDLIISQGEYILPYKYYSDKKNIYSYKSNAFKDNSFLTDYNRKTFIEINSKTQNEIILNFEKELIKDSFSFNFDYSTKHYKSNFYISQDGKTWDKISLNNIPNFSFKYLKIKFISNTNEILLENIKIYELSFIKKTKTILIKNFLNDDINIYSNNNCKDKKFYTQYNTYNKFEINSDTKTIKLELEKNPKYNVFIKKDSDNDGVEDINDNCINTYNPFQKDKNGNGRGDLCSDDDKDGIIGEKDNCIYISNSNQKDINRNGVGDVCEFDKDKDGIFDSIDNCINIPNPNQKDTDKDGIGDICDNSIYYNPRQLDKNNNGIGDVTEEKDKYLLENDDDKDGIINNKDNCINKSNPNQLDKDQDGVGDICDNSSYYNPKQIDKNNNGIGDISEDSDNDGIEGIKDNCINISNSDQKDSDNDGVGDLCEDKDYDKIPFANDNCPYDYNPDQKDIDKDQIGDVCDKDDNRYIESNSTFFIGLLIFITLIFGGGIYIMIKKLRNS